VTVDRATSVSDASGGPRLLWDPRFLSEPTKCPGGGELSPPKDPALRGVSGTRATSVQWICNSPEEVGWFSALCWSVEASKWRQQFSYDAF